MLFRSLKAVAVVLVSALAAGAVGASPIPFSDWILLLPIQIIMISTICACFTLKVGRGAIVALLASGLGAGLAGCVGMKILASAIKFVPGAGTAVGIAVDVTISSSFTLALGLAMVAALWMITSNTDDWSRISLEDAKEGLNQTFNSLYALKLTELQLRAEEMGREWGMDTATELRMKETWKNVDTQESEWRKRNAVLDSRIKESKEDLCAICHHNKPNVAISPCGHVPFCAPCFEENLQANPMALCPVDRKQITNHVIMFLPK